MLNILKNRNILPLAISSLVSKTGDFANDVVFALITIELLSSNYFYIGIIYFLKFIPYLFLGPVGGWFADVFPQKYNMICSDIFRFIVVLMLFFLYISSSLTIYSLSLCGMLLTVGRSFYQPSFRAYLPEVLDESELPMGNSLFQIIEDTSSILGPFLCSIIIVLVDKSFVIFIDSITYIISILLLPLLYKNKVNEQEKLSLLSIPSDTKRTLTIMRHKNTDLFMVIIGTSVSVLFTASLLRFVFPASLLSAFNKEEFVGYIFSIMSIGTVIGSFFYTKIVKKTTARFVMYAWVVYGILFFLVAINLQISLIGTIIFVFVLGFSGALVDISIITNIQVLSGKDIGKNYGLYSTLANTCEALSGITAGIISVFLGALSFPIMALFISIAAKCALYKFGRKK